MDFKSILYIKLQTTEKLIIKGLDKWAQLNKATATMHIIGL
jgi:hypothetical protein